VQNISAGGIGLLVNRAFTPGEVLSVELPGSPSRTVLACVIHSTPQDEGIWLLGCSFSTAFRDAELQAFGAHREQGADDDFRAYVRSPCDLEMGCHAVEEADPEPLQVKVLNLSAGGAGLLVSQPVEPGTLLSLDLPANEGPMTILGCVVYVSPRGEGEWVIGCNFANELPVETLQALAG
jgi:hypothetical protein